MTQVNPKTPYTKDYIDTLHSPGWRALKRQKIEECGSTCEKCGVWCNNPELHHKHYRTIGRERSCDVLLLCGACHRIEDGKRIRKKRNQRMKGIQTFGDRKYGKNWESLIPFNAVADEFDRWLKKRKKKRR
jgi:hypothetical protein